MHAHHAIVFAQLVIDGVGYGVHAILVAVRDKEMRPLPGVTVVDMGVKMGLNGVDNARLSFDKVRVPRTNLFNRSVFSASACMGSSYKCAAQKYGQQIKFSSCRMNKYMIECVLILLNNFSLFHFQITRNSKLRMHCNRNLHCSSDMKGLRLSAAVM